MSHGTNSGSATNGGLQTLRSSSSGHNGFPAMYPPTLRRLLPNLGWDINKSLISSTLFSTEFSEKAMRLPESRLSFPANDAQNSSTFGTHSDIFSRSQLKASKIRLQTHLRTRPLSCTLGIFIPS